MDAVSIIIILGIVQGFFLGVVFLFLKRENHRANTILGLLFILFSVSIVHFLLLRTDAYQSYPWLIGISFPVLFLFGPLYYFYGIILINRDYKFSPKDLLHLVPFLLLALFTLPVLLSPAEEKIKFMSEIDSGKESAAQVVIGVIQIFHLFAYLIAMQIRLKKYRSNLIDIRAETEKINLTWLYTVTFFFLVIFGFMLLLLLLWFFGFETVKLYSLIVPILVSIVIYCSGYTALIQNEILFSNDEINRLEGKKYEKSSLTKEKSEVIKNQLLSLLKEEKIHLDPEVSLARLSKKLEVSSNHLSQVINDNLGVTFFDLINSHRIEESKKMLKENQNFTILAIANDCGFNSKSAFNSAFKKFTGLTPSAYKSR